MPGERGVKILSRGEALLSTLDEKNKEQRQERSDTASSLLLVGTQAKS